MKEIQFNINEKPKTENEQVAYLVDNANVDIIQQYVDKYYNQSWSHWFCDDISNKIKKKPSRKFYIYFTENTVGYDYYTHSIANKNGYDIYYVIANSLMTLE